MAIWSGLGGGGTATTAAAVAVVVVGGVVGWQVMRPDPLPLTPDPSAVELAVVTPESIVEPKISVEVIAPEPAEPTPPSFDVVRVDADGNALVAGRAAPRATIKV